MPSFRTQAVAALIEAREGLQRVALDDGSRAYVLTELIGSVAVGDRVVVNTTAVDLGLGTGGWHVVHWNLAREEFDAPRAGHIMKLRYTSLQFETEPLVPRDAMTDGLPVVACTVHSQVACVAAAFKHARPDASVCYVMTDGGALPIALSDLVVSLRAAGLVDQTVTAGHAFGGDLEAVTVQSALAGVDADLVIVGMGPGVVGMGHPLASTAVDVAGVLDAVAHLGGRPILAVRYSDADPRSRHRGISHHSEAVLELVRSDVEVAVPDGVAFPVADRHRCVPVPDVDVPALLAAKGLRVTSMGRGPEDDPAFYAVAGAAGTLASLG
jgi:hypothetical protein